MVEHITSCIDAMYRALVSLPPIAVATWYTTLPKVKKLCRREGLSVKQSGRIVKRVSDGRMTVNQVLDHLSNLRKAS